MMLQVLGDGGFQVHRPIGEAIDNLHRKVTHKKSDCHRARRAAATARSEIVVAYHVHVPAVAEILRIAEYDMLVGIVQAVQRPVFLCGVARVHRIDRGVISRRETGFVNFGLRKTQGFGQARTAGVGAGDGSRRVAIVYQVKRRIDRGAERGGYAAGIPQTDWVAAITAAAGGVRVESAGAGPVAVDRLGTAIAIAYRQAESIDFRSDCGCRYQSIVTRGEIALAIEKSEIFIGRGAADRSVETFILIAAAAGGQGRRRQNCNPCPDLVPQWFHDQNLPSKLALIMVR